MNRRSGSTMRQPQLGDLGGAFGDLGTLLPLAAGLVIVSGVDARGFFITFGIATILSGFAFRLPMPVQPQKAVAAAAIAEQWPAHAGLWPPHSGWGCSGL